MRELNNRGHHVTFLERDVPWYTQNRDLPHPEYCDLQLYGSLKELNEQYLELMRDADMVMVGSYVPDGVAVGQWVCKVAQGAKCFYDIDTPVTLKRLEQIGEKARQKVLSQHTSAHRAEELETYVFELLKLISKEV